MTVKVSVLGYTEDDCWVAHALEMDVIGVGDTWTAALSELKENVRAQVSFAVYRGDESLIFHPAPPRLFKRFKQVREAELRALVKQPRSSSLSHIRSDALSIRRNKPEGKFAVA